MSDRVPYLRSWAAAAGAALAVLSSSAHAFADDDARKAILELRQQLQQQRDQSRRAQLQLADQIQQLQQQMAQLRDQIEMASRPQNGQSQGNAYSTDNAGGTAADPQEQSAYDGAIELFRKGQYKEAAEAFTAFTALYPHSELVPTAQFYLGSSRYALKDFKGAIETLQSMVQSAPDNARAPDALLVIAGSQIELNNRAGAKASLQRIVNEYPNAQAANTAKSRLQLLQ